MKNPGSVSSNTSFQIRVVGLCPANFNTGRILLFVLLLTLSSTTWAQVDINTNGSDPGPSFMPDVNSMTADKQIVDETCSVTIFSKANPA